MHMYISGGQSPIMGGPAIEKGEDIYIYMYIIY